MSQLNYFVHYSFFENGRLSVESCQKGMSIDVKLHIDIKSFNRLTSFYLLQYQINFRLKHYIITLFVSQIFIHKYMLQYIQCQLKCSVWISVIRSGAFMVSCLSFSSLLKGKRILLSLLTL